MDKLFEKIKAMNYNWINKYSIVVFVFIIWLSFFDKYSLLTQRKLTHVVNDLENREEIYGQQLQEALKEKEIMDSDIEKYAREQYYFHKDNEFVFKIEDPKEK